METQARKPLLVDARRRSLACLGIALVAACALVLGVSGCGGQASPRAASLVDRLDRMSPQAQLDTLRALARANPGDATLAFHIGNTFYTLGEELAETNGAASLAYLDSATTAYQRATEIDTAYSRAFVNMGLAYDTARKSNEARAAYRRAIAVNPGDVLAYCHLGFLEYTAGNRSEAMRLYQRALDVDANSAQAHYNLGLAFADARIFREALQEWERVVVLDPDGELGRTAAENVAIIRQYLAQTP